MCAHHDPQTCNLTLMGDGVFCVYNTRKRECLLFIQQHTNTHALPWSQCASSFTPLSSSRALTRVKTDKGSWLMFVFFLSMRKMWMRSERSGKWRRLCLDSDVSAALACRTLDLTKRSGAAHLRELTVDIHTEACAELSRPHGASRFMKK